MMILFFVMVRILVAPPRDDLDTSYFAIACLDDITIEKRRRDVNKIRGQGLRSGMKAQGIRGKERREKSGFRGRRWIKKEARTEMTRRILRLAQDSLCIKVLKKFH
ncbi:MAG TPA: hypothetical protein VMT12_08130 [Syntrophales bacterium]|nr:hypothetical protein [Syntrophales bacterium]